MNKIIGTIALALVVIGALNWALVGLFDFDLVAALFGVQSLLSRTIYVLVGVSGLYLALARPWRERVPTKAASHA